MRTQKAINHIFAILVFVISCYFILGEWFLPSDKMDDPYVCAEYAGEWERIKPDGTEEPVEIPGRCDADRNEIVIVETILPEDIESGLYLCFRSAKQDMRFYVDGALRKEYSTRETRLFGRMSAAAYIFLEIEEDDAGKSLRVEARTDSSYTGLFYPVYYGNPMGIWDHFFQQYGLELIVAFITLILSIIAIISSMALRFCYHRRVALEYLGWGILVAAVWLITNSVFRQLIFPNLSIINDITFLMVMLLALPYLLYMNEVQKGRYGCAYRIMECIVIINFFLYSGLHITEICDFTDSIAYISVICILSIVLMVITILLDMRQGRIKEYTFVAVGMLGVCAAAVVQIVIYFWKISLFNGVILAVGLIFLLLFSTLSTVYEIVAMDREKQQALQASESKGRFLASMSHEIRTPIHAVLGMNTMILRESKEPRIREYAQDIQNAGQTLLALINDILDISKLESGKLEILPAEYDFSSLIYDVMNMMEMKARDKGLTLNLSLDRETPSRLWGDDVRIRQILVNLISNAIKYTESGSVTLAVHADILGDTAKLTFRVEDTGIGIRQEDLEKLFHEFERIEEQRNRKIEGTGLGMNITTQLLERMGSRLQVESVYGEGSVFSFELMQKVMSHEPVGDLEQRIRKRAEEYSYHVMFTAPEARILVVDDNEVNRRVFVKLLKATQVQVDEAAGGEACLEIVRRKAYDLIFLDHMMPDLDGIAVLHRMREWEDYPCQYTPVIALTANAVAGAREMYLGEGFQDFLSKPINPEKLEKMIMTMLPKDKVICGDTISVSPVGEMAEEAEEMILPELEGIDWDYARLHCRDMELLKDIIDQFYASLEAEAARLEDLLEDLLESPEGTEEADPETLRRFRIQVHSMKNSAAMAGAVSLSGVARILEYAARDGRKEMISNITPAFLKEWRNMKDILRSVAEKRDIEEGEEEPNAALTKELLRLLENAMEEMDVDTADAIMCQLKGFVYRERAAEAVEKLALAVMDLDAEGTMEWSRQLLVALNGI